MLQLVLVVLLVVILVALIKRVAYIKKCDSAISWADGPKPLPIVGNALEFKDTSHILNLMQEYMIKYKGIVKVTVGPEPAELFITDLDMLKFFMTSNKTLAKSKQYSFLHPWLKLGLLTSTGTKWQQRRKLITPSFHFNILEQFIEIFNNSSDVLVEKLKSEVGKEVDISLYIRLLTLDVICESAMGIEINAQSGGNSEYVNSVHEMGVVIIRRVISPFKQSDFLYQFSRDAWKERRMLKVLHGLTDKVIKNRRKELGKRTDKSEENCYGIKRRTAFLDTLMTSTINGELLTDEDIREEVDTFMFEGHDTTSSAITFTLYALSKHSEIQSKVYQELKEIFGEAKDTPASHNDLQNMKYLEMVIKEALRLYTTVPFIARIVTEDIEYDGRVYPAGLNITFASFNMHRNPDIYPDPFKFDPERFTADNQSNRHPFAFLPFSAGPRNCIGQKFAMLELKSAVSKILRNYELKPAVNFEPILSCEMILKSRNGVRIKLEAR